MSVASLRRHDAHHRANMAEKIVVSERDVVSEVLDLYKNLPCLWDSTHEWYKNKRVRQEAMTLLLNKWKLFDRDATINTVRRKLENMRASFAREWKKIQICLDIDGGHEAVHKPKLWYFDKLLFLVDGENTMARFNNTTQLNDNSRDSNSEEDASEQQSEEEVTPKVTQKGVKRRHTEVKIEDELEVEPEVEPVEEVTFDQNSLVQEDSTESFSRTVCLQLREMSKRQRCIAEKLISEIVCHGKLEHLTMNSSLNLK